MSFSARHPHFSDLLVHLSGRARSSAAGGPEERLASILRERQIRATDTFSRGGSWYVSFTEVTVESLNHVFSRGSYAAWGVVFRKDFVCEQGGGPVLHVRSDEWADTAAWTERLKARVVRFDPARADWMWEREWRVPGTKGFRFDDSEIVAVIAPAAASKTWLESGDCGSEGAVSEGSMDLYNADKVWSWSRDNTDVRRAS